MNLLVIIIILWDLRFNLALILSCRGKVDTFWGNRTFKELTIKYINPFVYMYSLLIAEFITDGIILLMLILIAWRLHLPLSQKPGVKITFLLGSL